MSDQFDYDREEELRRERWNQRMAEMKRQKERREWLNQNLKKYAGCGIAVAAAVCMIGVGIGIHASDKEAEPQAAETSLEAIPEENVAMASTLENTQLDTVEVQESSETKATVNTEENVEIVDMTESTETESENAEPTETVGETIEVAEETEKEALLSEAATAPGQLLAAPNIQSNAGDVGFWEGYTAETTNATKAVSSEDVISEYAILMDASNGTIVAQRDAKTIINPASMTKILTVLVAAEHVTNLDEEFTITLEFTDYAYVNDCSSVGFLDGEKVTIRDLFYGTILPSGGDAAVALATYVAGSHEAFVDMMNAKLEELGLSETAHFTNCVGLYDKEHYCTVYDMAMIMKAAAENDLCREVMSARKYTTSATEQHPDGILISNWFLRRIEDKETGGEVLCAKTGFVNQSGSCAASYAVSDAGVPYICVTAKSTSSWKCIYDHVALYSQYTE